MALLVAKNIEVLPSCLVTNNLSPTYGLSAALITPIFLLAPLDFPTNEELMLFIALTWWGTGWGRRRLG